MGLAEGSQISPVDLSRKDKLWGSGPCALAMHVDKELGEIWTPMVVDLGWGRTGKG